MTSRTNQEMPTIEWPRPGYPFFPEESIFAPAPEDLAPQLAQAFLQDFAEELDQRRAGLKAAADPTPGQQEAYRQLTAAVAALRAADWALKTK